MMKPLFLAQDDWRSRWLVSPDDDFLHRVAEMDWGEYPPEMLEEISEEDRTSPEQLAEFKRDAQEEKIEGIGKAICGLSGYMHMPGIFSRMGLKRCPECCKLMNIPEGKGCPYNEGILEEGDSKD